MTPQVKNFYNTKLAGNSNKILLSQNNTEPAPIPKVENIHIQQELDLIKLAWNPFKSNDRLATRYKIQAYEKDPLTGKLIQSGNAISLTGTEYVTDSLTPGKTYLFEIVPLIESKYLMESATLSTEVTVEEKVQEVPPNYELETIGKLTKIKWDAVPLANRYRVSVLMENKDTLSYEAVGTPSQVLTSSYTAKNLIAGNKYKVVITSRIDFVYDESQKIELEFLAP